MTIYGCILFVGLCYGKYVNALNLHTGGIYNVYDESDWRDPHNPLGENRKSDTSADMLRLCQTSTASQSMWIFWQGIRLKTCQETLNTAKKMHLVRLGNRPEQFKITTRQIFVSVVGFVVLMLGIAYYKHQMHQLENTIMQLQRQLNHDDRNGGLAEQYDTVNNIEEIKNADVVNKTNGNVSVKVREHTKENVKREPNIGINRRIVKSHDSSIRKSKQQEDDLKTLQRTKNTLNNNVLTSAIVMQCTSSELVDECLLSNGSTVHLPTEHNENSCTACSKSHSTVIEDVSVDTDKFSNEKTSHSTVIEDVNVDTDELSYENTSDLDINDYANSTAPVRMKHNSLSIVDCKV